MSPVLHVFDMTQKQGIKFVTFLKFQKKKGGAVQASKVSIISPRKIASENVAGQSCKILRLNFILCK